MILAVRLDCTGPLAGVPVVCRHIEGLQRWLIRFDLLTVDGMHEQHETTCSEPIPLSALAPVAKAAIDELLAGGSIVARRASWKAYCLARPGQQKSARRRRG